MQTTERKRTLPPCRHKSQQSSISERTRLVEPRRERRSQTTKRMGRPFGLNLASTGHCQGGLMKEELSRRSEIIGKKTTQTEICKQESEEDNMASRQRDRRVEIRPPSSSAVKKHKHAPTACGPSHAPRCLLLLVWSVAFQAPWVLPGEPGNEGLGRPNLGPGQGLRL
jgi:hypothetical protein